MFPNSSDELLNNSVEVTLPDYTAKWCEFSVQVTPVYNGTIRTLNVSEVKNCKFSVYGEAGKFFWEVKAKRANIEVEPLQSNVVVKGDGPYKYI